MSLCTNKYYLTYFLGSKEKESSKMYEWGGTGSPLLGIHFWVNYDWMWSWLDLVGYTQNSVHLPLKMKHIKNKNAIKPQNRQKQPRQDSPEKTQQNQKNKSHKNNLDKFWYVLIILCFPSLFFFLCALVVYFFKPLYSLCCSAQKPGIQKGSKQTPYSNFWLERKRRVKNVWKEGGTGPTPP